jgi:predicted RNA methylase
MNPETFNRLHSLRMANDAAGYEMAEHRPRFDRLAGRHENGTAPRAIVSHQLFQTPPEVAAQLVALLDLKGGERVLEPSAGLGRILDALASYKPAEVIAVEIAATCAGELYKQNRPGVKILQRDFLACDFFDIGLVDAVAMNPPFTMRSDIKHIQAALQFLRKGGRLAAICMNTEHRRAAFRDIASTWIELPERTFKHEGTNVPTVLFTIDQK